MRHPLADTYAEGRERLLQLAAELSDAEAATRSTACPEWSVKDIYAHLAGIATDILAGNTIAMSTFEFGRISMGRRSMTQLRLLDWPVPDPRPHLDVLVRWSIADRDVIDPVVGT